MSAILSAVGLIAMIGLILLLAYGVTRLLAGQYKVRNTGKQMEILEQLFVGQDRRLVMVRAGERFFLLGISPAGIEPVAEYTPEQAKAFQQTPEDFQTVLRKAQGGTGGQPKDFWAKIQKFLQSRSNK